MTAVIDNLRRRVAALCSEECAGREAGSPEGARARAFLVAELEAAGVTPILQPVPGCRGTNVLARFGQPDADAILVGAHYDHLGRAGAGHAYWGADDNAAAVAALLELVGRLRAAPPACQVVVAFFDGEEPPFFLTPAMGSMQYVEAPVVPLERTRVAIILDLIGHAIGPEQAPAAVRDTLFVLGGEKTAGHPEVVTGAGNALDGATVRQFDLDLVPPLSDYEPFRRREVPVLFLTCARWRHYHELSDTPDRLDFPKIGATAELVDRLMRGFAALSSPLARYQPDRHDHARTVAEMLDLARALTPVAPAAQVAVQALEELAGRAGAGLSQEDWARLQQLVGMMEQNLA